MGRSIGRTLLLSFILPLAAIQVLLQRGAAPIAALTVAALFPLIEIAIEAVATRCIGIIAAVALTGIVTGLALAFVTGNAVFAVLKDSAFTGVFGLVFLGSLFTPRPLIYRLNLEMAGNDAAARAKSVALWGFPRARESFRVITVVWGLGLLLDATIRIVATFALPLVTATSLSPVISVVAIGLLAAWTVVYARTRRRAPPAAA